MRLLFIVVITFSLFLTGCWGSNEIDTLAINVAIGIDKDGDKCKITSQIINPRVIAVGENANESPVIIFEKEGTDLDEAILKMTSKSSRKLFNLHLRMLVISEEAAKHGIKNIIEYFFRNNEYRTDFYIVIAKDATARDILKVLSPTELIPAIDMYESLELSGEREATTKPVKIIELANAIISEGKNPTLTGIKIDEEEEIIPDSIEELQKSSNIKKLAHYGIGVLKEDKLIGWLNEEESKGFNYITGNVYRAVIHSHCEGGSRIAYQIIKLDSKITADLIDGKPVINVKLNVLANIRNIFGELDVTDVKNIKVLVEEAEKRIKNICEDTLNKVQNEFKTDIFGFGEVIYRKYPKLWKELKDDWDSKFSDLDVYVDVNVKINQLGQITKPVFMKGN
jgi:spore germination protein KC